MENVQESEKSSLRIWKEDTIYRSGGRVTMSDVEQKNPQSGLYSYNYIYIVIVIEFRIDSRSTRTKAGWVDGSCNQPSGGWWACTKATMIMEGVGLGYILKQGQWELLSRQIWAAKLSPALGMSSRF